MKHKGTITIETERLILRKFCEADVQAAFNNWTSDEEVTRFLRWPAHENVGVTEWVLCDWIASYEKENFYQWAIVPKEIGEPIGTISVVGLNERIEMVHMGYCIGRKWWNKGYTSEALSALISFFFEQVEVKRIEAQHDPKNLNSGKVMEKCGLIYEGTMRKADWSNQGIIDVCMYGMLASDYFKE